MTETAAATAPARLATASTADAATHADAPAPLACRHCGYDLRMHPGATGDPVGDCPECGCPLAVSRRLDALADADARYRRGLVAGSGWLITAVTVALPAPPIGLALAVVAAWRLTHAEPARFDPTRDRVPRLFARAAVTLGVVGLLGLAIATLVALATGGLRLTGNLGRLDAALLTTGALAVTGLLGLWRHLGHVAQRGSDPALADRLRALHRHWLVAVGLVGGLALLAAAFDWAYHLYALQHPASAPTLFAAFAAVLIWLWAITLRAAIALRRSFRRLAIDS